MELFATHRGELVNYASRIVGDRAHAEDVVQEAYLRLDAVLLERSLREPLAYLYRIVRNLSLDMRRKMMREHGWKASSATAIDDIAEDRPSPESEVGARGEVRLIAQAMAELPARTRAALELHRFEGCSIREIAGRLDVSVGTAHALVIDGLEHCRRRLFRGR